MNTKLLKIGLVIAIMVIAAGCLGAADSSESEDGADAGAGLQVVEDAHEDRDNDEIRAYYDEDGEMVCFTFRDGNNAASTGGLDCEPINETAYEPEDF